MAQREEKGKGRQSAKSPNVRDKIEDKSDAGHSQFLWYFKSIPICFI